MAVEFVSWQTEYTRWLNALANRNTDAFFVSTTENSREMRVMYTKLENITKFTEWLKEKASAEAVSAEDGGGGILMSIGGE